MFAKQILILVPHPDDEVVACATAISRAQAEGAKIYSLYLTHGCLARDVVWPWERKGYDRHVAGRQAEATRAAHYLDIEPIGWFMRPARHLWQNIMSVYEEVQDAIVHHQIDQIWVPAYEGGNPDHDALNAIGQKFKDKISVLEFAEYNFCLGKARSHTFPRENGSERVIDLSANDSQRKKKALEIYKSEKSNLSYVEVKRESYRSLADYDYGEPPHLGTLWYARFQWVPFRHPRVDFTNPEDVSRAICDFLNK